MITKMSELPGAVLERPGHPTPFYIDHFYKVVQTDTYKPLPWVFRCQGQPCTCAKRFILWWFLSIYILVCVCVCVCTAHSYICKDVDSSRNPHKLAAAEPWQPLRFEGWELEKQDRLLIDYQNDQRRQCSAIWKLCPYLSNGYGLQL